MPKTYLGQFGLTKLISLFKKDINNASETAVASKVKYSDGSNLEDKKFSELSEVSVTLTKAGWNSDTMKQTVQVSGVSATVTAQKLEACFGTEANMDAYIDAGILMVEQAANSVTFRCDSIPTVDISLYVAITTFS